MFALVWCGITNSVLLTYRSATDNRTNVLPHGHGNYKITVNSVAK